MLVVCSSVVICESSLMYWRRVARAAAGPDSSAGPSSASGTCPCRARACWSLVVEDELDCVVVVLVVGLIGLIAVSRFRFLGSCEYVDGGAVGSAPWRRSAAGGRGRQRRRLGVVAAVAAPSEPVGEAGLPWRTGRCWPRLDVESQQRQPGRLERAAQLGAALLKGLRGGPVLGDDAWRRVRRRSGAGGSGSRRAPAGESWIRACE